jgi:hypothetical protein
VTLTVTDNEGCSTAFVFTGETAYCNRAPAAAISHQVTIPGAPVISIAAPAPGGTYAVGQVVATSFSCLPGTDSSGVSSCTDSNGANGGSGQLDTSTTGPHTYAVTGSSNEGPTATKSVSYTVAAAPTLSLTTPANGARYSFGQKVVAAFSCADGVGGPGISACSGTVGDGRLLDTSKPGVHEFSVAATSVDGQTSRRTVSYTVLPSNKLLRVRHKAHRDGTFVVALKVPGPGRVDVLITAWKDNLASVASTLQPAKGRFAFARATANPARAGMIQITVRPNAKGRLLIAHPRYRVTLRLRIRFSPVGGYPRDIGYAGLHLP